MALTILVIFVLLAVASALGWAVDSRDGADWAPSAHGDRVARWH